MAPQTDEFEFPPAQDWIYMLDWAEDEMKKLRPFIAASFEEDHQLNVEKIDPTQQIWFDLVPKEYTHYRFCPIRTRANGDFW